MTELLSAEWLKIRTVRSTCWILAVLAGFVGLTVWVAWYGANTPGAIPPGARADFALATQAKLTADVAGLCFAVLGVLAITSEYSTGMIGTTFAAVPRRRAVLSAKAVVIAATALVLGQASVLTTYLITRIIIGGSLPAVSGELPALLAMGLSVTMYALIGLGLATIMRSAAGAIANFVGLWYILPIVAGNLPAPWGERISSFLPGALAGQLAGAGNDQSVFGSLLPPPGALAAMLGYVAVPLGVAAVVLTRRDVRATGSG
jgi:ABC-2 type transport system permease protein